MNNNANILNRGLFKKMEHVGLGAVDTTALADWYCTIFNLHKICTQEGTPPIYFLSDEKRTFTIEIFPATAISETREHAIHFCFMVEDMDRTLQYLREQGINTGEIVPLASGGLSLFFSDPANHTVQIVYRPIVLWN